MKTTVILTSSIFYLLGLKITDQVKLNQKLEADSLNLSVKKEIVLPEEDVKVSPDIHIEEIEADTKSGSSEDIAPWFDVKDDLE